MNLTKIIADVGSSRSFELLDRLPLTGKLVLWAVVPGATCALFGYYAIKYLERRRVARERDVSDIRERSDSIPYER